MRFYQTITILPDALISAVFLRQQIWRQLHLILAENKTGENSSAVAGRGLPFSGGIGALCTVSCFLPVYPVKRDLTCTGKNVTSQLHP